MLMAGYGYLLFYASNMLSEVTAYHLLLTSYYLLLSTYYFLFYASDMLSKVS